MTYKDEDFLQIAGIQHFTFCRRQWALIHLEQEWEENVKTVEGHLVHENAHNDQLVEKRGNTLITRGLEVSSETLGIYGICDVVEFHKSDDGTPLFHYEGIWLPMSVEYKRGKPKINDADRFQLAAQTMCLEEIFHCKIQQGALFYHEVKHREILEIDDVIRSKVIDITSEMHELYKKQHTPKVKTGTHCYACSLRNICMPKLNHEADVQRYIKQHIEEES